MFGYVTPCKMELKIKDFEMFKAYYCGLCKSIKVNYGNFPRISLNYDMTFLAILLDSLNDNKTFFNKRNCVVHPLKKKIVIENNKAIDYAAFCNVILFYFKLLDDVNDEKSTKSKLYSSLFRNYLKKIPKDLHVNVEFIKSNLENLYLLEKTKEFNNLDEISHPFSEITAHILSSYVHNNSDTKLKESIYNLGYNLGKWIYIIDAFDDLNKDIKENKFNPFIVIYQKENKNSNKFNLIEEKYKERANFTLSTCGRYCLNYLNKLPLKKNEDILFNILQFGLLEKMDKVFKRSEEDSEQSV